MYSTQERFFDRVGLISTTYQLVRRSNQFRVESMRIVGLLSQPYPWYFILKTYLYLTTDQSNVCVSVSVYVCLLVSYHRIFFFAEHKCVCFYLNSKKYVC